ncbi:hypothetical protein SSS_00705 [Sarcoptes scabiei]|nr:hypothetical protein SSS_00705 [Sarcoptes scabiei]
MVLYKKIDESTKFEVRYYSSQTLRQIETTRSHLTRSKEFYHLKTKSNPNPVEEMVDLLVIALERMALQMKNKIEAKLDNLLMIPQFFSMQYLIKKWINSIHKISFNYCVLYEKFKDITASEEFLKNTDLLREFYWRIHNATKEAIDSLILLQNFEEWNNVIGEKIALEGIESITAI